MKMSQQRFFLLQEPIPAAIEAGSFLGRLVVSKTSPLDRFAPFSDPAKPPHDTNDIIPSILPSPEVETSYDGTLTVARKRPFSVPLAGLLNMNLSRTEEESRRLESKLVKRYRLRNPCIQFELLMQNQFYAQDARELLKNAPSGHVYLVTGFITASESTWTVEATNGSRKDFSVTVPVGAAAGIPDFGLLDAGFGLNGSISNKRSQTRHVAEEQIFAVAYSIVKLSIKLKWPSGLATRVPVVSRPKRAKAYHLAMGGDGDDSDEEFEWNSDDEVGVVKESKDFNAMEKDVGEIILHNGDPSSDEDDHDLFIDVV
ncbi:hypothetical protein B0J13DRAFT_557456 [Dactylonectria estremocensis]|uniref:Uncharacterized protein n=1 Tax=Dactylonectria estremocensis TaxID=1079267 RepID=A0A9P9J021_9HYPO|nr:hypothetical protein B0J13DRAFT_557456 [Dactylonectria estremocensis]